MESFSVSGRLNRRVAIDQLSRVNRCIDFGDHPQVGGGVKERTNVEELLDDVGLSEWMIKLMPMVDGANAVSLSPSRLLTVGTDTSTSMFRL